MFASWNVPLLGLLFIVSSPSLRTIFARLLQCRNASAWMTFSLGGARNSSSPLPLKQSSPISLSLLPS